MIKKDKKLNDRLSALGLKVPQMMYRSYLEHHPESFQSPYDAGCRMFILYAVATVSYFPDERYGYLNWLKENGLWDKTSPSEQDFLLDKNNADEKTNDMAWKFDAARTLAWCLNLFDDLHPIDRIATQDEDSRFMEFIMKTRDNVPGFLQDVRFRPLEQIHEEHLINELATLYGHENETSIKWPICSERRAVMTWLTKLSS